MVTEKPLVVGVGGSIRNRASIDEVEGVDEAVESDALLKRIESLEHRDIYHEEFLGEIQPLIRDLTSQGEKLITNSDALVLTSLYGAMDVVDVEFAKLTEYVGVDTTYADSHIDFQKLEPLMNLVDRADGLILGTPVYFGDRSSLMHSFLNLAAEHDLLRDTVVGAVSVGSKRNGGQETANIYALFENLNHGAIVVGNGPKTCQYGGTGWGGDIGDVAEDDFGLETSLGTGLRVADAAKLRSLTREFSPREIDDMLEEPLSVGVLVTRDKEGRLRSTVEERIEAVDVPNFEFNIIDFSQTFIQACIGCDVCPTPGKVGDVSGNEQDYKCIIDRDLDDERWDRDELQDLHDSLMENEALIIGALDTGASGVRDVYQALLERTRYLRRDDWRLHNRPLAAYVLTAADRSSTYPLKIMTSWMRHNTLVHPPIVETTFSDEGDVPVDGAALDALQEHYNTKSEDALASFVRSAKAFRVASRLTGSDQLSYKATGYANKMLDDTVAERT